MDENTMWRLVEEAAAGASDVEEQAERLTDQLATLSAKDVVEFERLLDVQYERANRWDLWAAAYVALGGCSDDNFDYFRAWLVALGKKAFEVALADPDALAGLGFDDEDFGDGEALMYAAGHAYERITGEHEMPVVDGVGGEPAGTRFDGEDWDGLVRRFPRLAARFDMD